MIKLEIVKKIRWVDVPHDFWWNASMGIYVSNSNSKVWKRNELKDTTKSNISASYLDQLLSVRRDDQLNISIYDKHDRSS